MNVTVDNVFYTRIGANEACVGTEDGSKRAVSTSTTGEIKILPSVPLDTIYCVVTMIGKNAFLACKKLTKISIPNTVKILKDSCLGSLELTEPLIFPQSIEKVETWFLSFWASNSLIFCGEKEPEMVNVRENNWISATFNGSVFVPLNYEKETFCQKPVNKIILTNCPKYRPKRIFTCYRKQCLNPKFVNIITFGVVS